MTDEQLAVATKWLDEMRGDATLFEPSPEALATLLSEREAAARAGAVEACVQRIERRERERDPSVYRADSPLEIAMMLREEALAATPPDRVVVARETIEAARDVLARCRTWFAWQFDPAGRAPAPKEYGANLVAGLDAALARLGESDGR